MASISSTYTKLLNAPRQIFDKSLFSKIAHSFIVFKQTFNNESSNPSPDLLREICKDVNNNLYKDFSFSTSKEDIADLIFIIKKKEIYIPIKSGNPCKLFAALKISAKKYKIKYNTDNNTKINFSFRYTHKNPCFPHKNIHVTFSSTLPMIDKEIKSFCNIYGNVIKTTSVGNQIIAVYDSINHYFPSLYHFQIHTTNSLNVYPLYLDEGFTYAATFDHSIYCNKCKTRTGHIAEQCPYDDVTKILNNAFNSEDYLNNVFDHYNP